MVDALQKESDYESMKASRQLVGDKFNTTIKLLRKTALLWHFNRQMSRINKVGDVKNARICFLDLYPVHYQFSKETIRHLALKKPVVLLVTDKSHPAYLNKGRLKNVYVFLLDAWWLPFALNWLRIPYLVTPASHLHSSAVRAELNIVHSYHSLVSMHAVYGDDAFDTYTHFFACGPHHVDEVHAIKSARGLPAATVYKVGYPKLDEQAVLYATQKKQSSTQKTILLAPSWHPENLLKMHCKELCNSILKLGHNLIVRPHPHLYERDYSTMQTLRALASQSEGRLVIENPSEDAFLSFMAADLMISDWSGVAFEYAFATERPVIFIDASRKSNSIELLDLNLPTIEDTLRSQVGTIVENIDQLADGIRGVCETSPEVWAEHIREVRAKHIYNFLNSAETGANILANLAEDAEMLPPIDAMTMDQIELLI